MGMIGIVISICILGIGIWAAQTNKTVSTSADVQGEIAPILSPTQTPAPTVTPISTQYPSTIPTKAPSVQITIQQNNNQNSTSLSISKFQYPGASVNSSSQYRLELTTADSAAQATDWYKNTINSIGMNTKSFVTTSSNDNIVNKLVAADGNSEVRVDITRGPNDSLTNIAIELK